MGGTDFLGGGVIVLVAAALWIVYLLPALSRRRRFVATERNAVRLQQTIRILAESAEVPEEVRLETSAREVAAQRRMLRHLEAKQKAERDRMVAEAKAEAARARAEARAADRAARQVARARSRRRLRGWFTLLGFAGLLAIVVGAVLVMVGGSGVVTLLGAGAVLVSLVAIVALAPRQGASRARAVSAPAAPLRRHAGPVFDAAAGETAPEAEQAEEPAIAEGGAVPVPRPLYLARRSAEQGPAFDAEEVHQRLLREARLAQERFAAKSASAHVNVAEIGLGAQEAPRPARRSVAAVQEENAAQERNARFAAMGIVDVDSLQAPDLDQALQRRRNAG